ncbi:hypothetical protein, partial [Klebsiella michiganensis]
LRDDSFSQFVFLPCFKIPLKKALVRQAPTKRPQAVACGDVIALVRFAMLVPLHPSGSPFAGSAPKEFCLSPGLLTP